MILAAYFSITIVMCILSALIAARLIEDRREQENEDLRVRIGLLNQQVAQQNLTIVQQRECLRAIQQKAADMKELLPLTERFWQMEEKTRHLNGIAARR